MNILQLSIYDINGGAERIAWDLHQAYLKLGHNALLVVGTKRSDHLDVVGLQPDRGSLSWLGHKLLRRAEYETGVQALGFWRFGQWWNNHKHEWDIVHVHNLHSGYFDLSALQEIARTTPVVQTLHDAWQITGHCAHPKGCERWQSGCGACPDLAAYPGIRRDNTAFNWRRKRRIYTQARPHLVVPSEWLRTKLAASFLRDLHCTTIPNGVDIRRYVPGDQFKSRRRLGLPLDKKLLLFTANGGLKSTEYKAPELALSALHHLVYNVGREDILLVAVGGETTLPAELSPYVVQRPFVQDGLELYYQAADILVYPSRADNCPLVILEAMACGLPVVATNVGGIPELISHGADGLVVPSQDVEAFANAIGRILQMDAIRMRESASAHVRTGYSMDHMVQSYLDLYREILDKTVQPESSPQ